MRYVTLLVLTACGTDAQCLRDQDGVREMALEHAADCTYEPELIENTDCAGFDNRVLRAYIGAFCSAATLSCIDASEEATADCYGRPFES